MIYANEFGKSTAMPTTALDEGLDIGELAQRLRTELVPYISCPPAGREQLMREYARPLLDLLVILHPLCQSPEERETLIRFQQILEDVRSTLS